MHSLPNHITKPRSLNTAFYHGGNVQYIQVASSKVRVVRTCPPRKLGLGEYCVGRLSVQGGLDELTLRSSSSPVFDAWEEAKRQCLSDISASEQQLIDTATLQRILADVKRAEQNHGEFSKSRKLSKRLNPVISGIEQYGKALDILVGTSQGILSPLWGGIRILLHVSSLYKPPPVFVFRPFWDNSLHLPARGRIWQVL